MKVKATKLLIGDDSYYIVQTKEHWWNRWHFIFSGQYPRLFTPREFRELHFKAVAYNMLPDYSEE